MIAVDFETHFPQHKLAPPQFVALFSLPHWTDYRGATRRQLVRRRKSFNKARRATLRLVRHLKRKEQPQVWRHYPDHVYAFILGGARRFTPNETGRKNANPSPTTGRGSASEET